MLKSIAKKITVTLASNNIIKTEEIEAYSYGLELLVPKVILYVAILIVSIITNTFLISFAFVILLMSLRRYTGGFHCKTAEACLLFSFFIYLIVLFGYNYVQYLPKSIYGLSSAISAIIVFAFAPVEDINRPLDNNEKIQFRKKALISLVLIILIEIFSILFRFDALCYVSACSLTVNAVLILLATRRCKYEKNIVKSSS